MISEVIFIVIIALIFIVLLLYTFYEYAYLRGRKDAEIEILNSMYFGKYREKK